MPKKPFKKPKLKPSPLSPHVEVVDQNGTFIPVNKIEIQEDAEGIFLVKVEVQLPDAVFSILNSYASSGHNVIR